MKPERTTIKAETLQSFVIFISFNLYFFYSTHLKSGVAASQRFYRFCIGIWDRSTALPYLSVRVITFWHLFNLSRCCQKNNHSNSFMSSHQSLKGFSPSFFERDGIPVVICVDFD